MDLKLMQAARLTKPARKLCRSKFRTITSMNWSSRDHAREYARASWEARMSKAGPNQTASATGEVANASYPNVYWFIDIGDVFIMVPRSF